MLVLAKDSAHAVRVASSQARPQPLLCLCSPLVATPNPTLRTVLPSNMAIEGEFVVAMVKGDSNDHWAIKGGSAQAAGDLRTMFDGRRPPRYHPMRKQGAVLLGIGGDNSDGATGTFFEGVMLQGFSTDAADAAAQADIVRAGYGK